MTTGTVGSNNLTSLYSNTTSFTTGLVNSSVYSVNGGLGVTVNPTTGNVVVSIGQDVATTANVQFANVTATGNLSNNYYTLANALGTNGQVLTTNGAGVTTWTTPSTLGLVNSVTGSGAGISVSPTTGAVIVSNTGVTSAVAGTGIGVSAGTGAVTFSNTGVTSIVAGSNISISGATGAVTISATGLPTGDVVGPASATDNAIVRFDQTTGKLIQNSVVTIADTTGNIVTPGDIAVNGGDITTTQTTASVFNTTATTLNIGSAATTIQIGNNQTTGLTTNRNAFYSFGNITTAGDLITINSDKTDTDVYLNFGRVAPGNNAAIRWNKTTDSFEWSADSTTWYDFINATLTPTFYNGQLLSYRNSEWINDNVVITTDVNERSVFSYRPLTPIAGPNTSLFLRKDYSDAAPGTAGVGTYADGAGVSLSFAVQSDTQAPPSGSAGQQNTYATVTGVYSSTVPTVSLRTSINNSTFTSVANFSTTAATIGGTTLTLDANNAGAANNSTIIANRGSSGTDASIGWVEANNFWQMSNNLFVDNYVIGGVGLATNGNDIFYNNEDTSPSGTCNLTVKSGVSAGVSANFRWNDSTKRWQDTIDGTTYYNLPNQNLDTTSDVSFSSVTVDTISGYDTQTTTTTATTAANISATIRKTQKVVIYIKDNVTNEIHVLEALAMAVDATTALLTTYAEMYSGAAALATFTADVSSGTLRILATPATTNSTTFQAQRITLGN